MHVWKTLKIFVSSTFKDLELERDELAKIFRELQDEIFARRLHLIQYDLRWRDRHEEEDLVNWCLEMVAQCQYFVGILGYRYGWRPPTTATEEVNSRNISITEMEIEQALTVIPKEKRFFCFGDIAQYSEKQLNSEEEEDKQSIENLKKRLMEQGEQVFVYQNSKEILTFILSQLKEKLNADYPPGQKVELESYNHQEALLEIIEEKRKGFVGRAEYLQQLKDFCQGDWAENYLALYAVAGTGKSSLLAQFLTQWQQQNPTIPIIGHYMSMAGDSRSALGVLQSLGEQLQSLDLLSKKLEVLPDALAAQIQKALQASKQKLIMAIDGLDEMDEIDKNLNWLPKWLPANVRVILTVRPVSPFDKLKEYPQLGAMELPQLEDAEICEIIKHYTASEDLKLSETDEGLLVKRAAGSPLFLKVALDEMAAGGVAVGQLAETVDALFHQILKRLQKIHGEKVINDYLGLIAAGRSGLAEAELQEILSIDHGNQAFDDFLLRVHKALENFVIRRERLLNFFHPQFGHSIKMFLGKAGMRSYHQRLGDYFGKKGYSYERALLELPYQLQWGEEYKKLLQTLSDIEFLETKCSIGMLVELKQDLEFAYRKGSAVSIPDDLQIEIDSDVYVLRNTIRLLERAIYMDIAFLGRHPECLAQSLWNRCYWHDCPDAALHYEDSGENLPWNTSERKLYKVVEHWRKIKEKHQWLWLKSLRPLPDRLDSPLLKIFEGHEAELTSVCLSKDGRKIVSGSHDGTVRVWDVASGECLLSLSAHNGTVYSASLSNDGLKVASGGSDYLVRIWDMASGHCLLTLRGHSNWVYSIAWSNDNRKLVSGSFDQTMILWDAISGDSIFGLPAHEGPIHTVCFSSDDSKIVSGGWDSIVRVWDAEYGQCLYVLKGHENWIYGVCANNNRIASGSSDNTIRVWDIDTGRCIAHLKGHEWVVASVAISGDGNKIVSGSWDGTVRVWDVASSECTHVLQGHEGEVESVHITAGSSKIVSGSYDKTIRLWDAASRERILTLKGHNDCWVESVCLSHSGNKIASGAEDTSVRLWDTKNGECIFNLEGHQSTIESVYINPSGSKVISGSFDKTIGVWDGTTGESLLTLKGHTYPVKSVSLNITEDKIVSGSYDKTIRIWDAKSGTCLDVLEGHKAAVTSVAIGTDKIVSGSYDKTVRLWDIASKDYQTFTGSDEWVKNVCLNKEGTRVIAAYDDETIKIWDAENGKCLEEIKGNGNLNQFVQSYEELPYYALAKNLETEIANSKDRQPIVFFPAIIEEATMASNNILTGRDYSYIFILQLQL